MSGRHTNTNRRAVIAGLGVTEMGAVYGRSSADFAAEAVRLAAADAGLSMTDVDGLLTSGGTTGGVGLGLQRELGLFDLKLLSEMQAFGSTAGGMVQFASMAVESGMADTVACVFADAPLRPGRAAGDVYSGGRRPDQGSAPLPPPAGWGGLLMSAGVVGANTMYALAARRHMEKFGTTTEDFAAIAVAQRDWATMNPLAQLREPITVEDHHASRWIADPFRKLDCCLVSNGGVAVIVTTEERAANLARPPVHVLGWAQRHPGRLLDRDPNFGLVTGAAQSGPAALAMAGLSLNDIQVAELYDCYTFTVLVSLEDYGFCEKGEGGAFVSSGAIGPNGSLKLNTGGGQLSAYYMWGMTPLSEAIIQVRGEGGDRQVHPHDTALVSGNGGILDHHSTLVLGSSPS
ncbi:MAG TPA: thiolase family protein [Acidimicrobiales bacterium]|nr:thiolase family protein [Acidimicrobiales bacterium]